MSITLVVHASKCAVSLLRPNLLPLAYAQVFEAIVKATSSIRGSRVFKTILRTVLAAGNYLNHGTRNGNAIGFR